MTRFATIFAAAVLLAATAAPCRGQVSFTSAIDLALRNSPRVKMAESEVTRARAALAEAHDVYIPSLVASSGLGYSYGYPLGTPTIFSFQAQSLVFSASQFDYIRAARSSLDAANLSLKDIRQQVAEDTAITYLALDRAQGRRAAMASESAYAVKLVNIVGDRLDAGQDTEMELTKARRTVVQLRLQQLQMDHEIMTHADHLGRLLGIGGSQFETLSDSIPHLPVSNPASTLLPDSPSVLTAFANAKSKREQAVGDSRYAWRPQISFAAQYSRFSTFNNYQLYYPAINNNYNAIGVGVQIQLPIFDAAHKARARQSLAAADSSENEALFARQQEAEERIKRRNSVDELVLRAELAGLDNEIAKQQLDAMLVQLNSGTGNSGGPQMTPKDEQNARIQERQKYLELLDSQFELRRIEISLLRLNGSLENWLRSTAATEQPASITAPVRP